MLYPGIKEMSQNLREWADQKRKEKEEKEKLELPPPDTKK